jgi:hypothetical protein
MLQAAREGEPCKSFVTSFEALEVLVVFERNPWA